MGIYGGGFPLNKTIFLPVWFNSVLFFLFFFPCRFKDRRLLVVGRGWIGGGDAITDRSPPNFTQSYVGKANSSEPLPLKGPRIDGPADGVKWGRSHMQRLPPISASFTQRPQTRPFPRPSLSGEFDCDQDVTGCRLAGSSLSDVESKRLR